MTSPRPDSSADVAPEAPEAAGPALSPALNELLAAERVPPAPAAGLERRVWERLESGVLTGASSGVTGRHAGRGSRPGERQPPSAGLIGKPLVLGGGAVALAGVLVGVFLSANEPGPASRDVQTPSPAQASTPSPEPRTSSERAPQPDLGPSPGRAAPDPGHRVGDNAQVPQAAQRPVAAEHTAAEHTAVEQQAPKQQAPEQQAPEQQVLKQQAAAQEVKNTKPRLAPTPADPVAERALLTRARAALRDGSPDAASSALAEHRRLYPRGALSEEREALKVHALAAAGRTEEARSARARFTASYPRSIHTLGLNSLEL